MMSCDQRQKHLKKVLDKSCTPFEDSIASYAASSSSYVSSANTNIFPFHLKSVELVLFQLSCWNAHGEKLKSY